MQRYYVTGASVVVLACVATAFLWTTHVDRAEAHCQVPCGIYDDPARIAELHEDATTISKAMAQINELSGKHAAIALNQAVRWVNTKEEHAAHVMTTVAEYFLAQRVKPVAAGAEGYDAYVKSLADHHAVLVAAMKCKQNTDVSSAQELDSAIHGLEPYYKK